MTRQEEKIEPVRGEDKNYYDLNTKKQIEWYISDDIKFKFSKELAIFLLITPFGLIMLSGVLSLLSSNPTPTDFTLLYTIFSIIIAIATPIAYFLSILENKIWRFKK